MKYLHTMVRVTDIDASLRFFCQALGLTEISRKEVPQGRYTLVFLAAPGDERAGKTKHCGKESLMKILALSGVAICVLSSRFFAVRRIVMFEGLCR